MAYSFEYTAPPTVAKFLRCKDELTFIKGPIGSGKSVGCCIKILLYALWQEPGIDGVRRTRFVVVRNTQDQLNKTTLKTWQEWFPDGELGRYKITEHTYTFSFTPPDGIPVYSEVMFLALDDPKDVAKILSLEVTGAWINECREIPQEIVEQLSKRCGRYPSQKMRPQQIEKDNWPTWYGLFGDTNAPERDSYWHNVFEHLPQEDDCDDPDSSILICSTFSQPAGDAPDAENIENLPKGYYDRGGRSEEWYRTMVQVQYGRSLAGRPVYERAFKERHVSRDTLKIHRYLAVVIGLDTARQPAAVFQQQTLSGKILTQHEAVEFNMGAKAFISRRLRPVINNYYPDHCLVFVMDPAGSRKNETDDNSWYKEIKAQFKGHTVKFAATNDLNVRINATDDVLRSWPDGEPLNQIDPACKYLIQGLRGKYRYDRIKKAGGESFTETPVKNNWSHVVEAKQYADLFMTSKHFRNEDYVKATRTSSGSTKYRPADPYTGY